MQWLARLVAGLSKRRPELPPGSVHIGFVVDKVALRQVCHRVIRFDPVNIIPPLLHINSRIIWRTDNGPVKGRRSIETEYHSTATRTMNFSPLREGKA
jgi:hypothetical protein